MGLELLVDHKALDPSQWTIQKVFFQGRYYESLAQLEKQFQAGQVNVVVIPDNGTGGSWSQSPTCPWVRLHLCSSILRAPTSVSR